MAKILIDGSVFLPSACAKAAYMLLTGRWIDMCINSGLSTNACAGSVFVPTTSDFYTDRNTLRNTVQAELCTDLKGFFISVKSPTFPPLPHSLLLPPLFQKNIIL